MQRAEMSETAKAEWGSVCQFSEMLKETKDCAVKAVAMATGVHYVDVHSLMAANGRKTRKGTLNSITYKVLRHLGFKWTGVKFQARTIRTLEREFKHRPGTYLVWVRQHILVMKDGEVIDWTKNRQYRIQRVEQITNKWETA